MPRENRPEPPDHGGDARRAGRIAGIEDADWLDLSTGINAMSYPHDGIPPSAFTRLPESDLEAASRDAAAAFYGAAGSHLVAPVPGTQAALQWLPRLRPSSRVRVVGPTYAEHAHTWRAAGHEVRILDALPAAGADVDVIVVVNPNNPDGRIIAPERLIQIAGDLAGHGGWLVVDEAFAEVAPEISIAAQAGMPGLVVLRSFGKFFGLAGLRLGFVLAWPALVREIAAALGPWAVSGPALSVAGRALRDGAWIAATRARLGADAARLDGMLTEAGLRVVGGTHLFRLAAAEDGPAWFARLLRAGIAVRRFRERPDWLRFGLPGRNEDWIRLSDALVRKGVG